MNFLITGERSKSPECRSLCTNSRTGFFLDLGDTTSSGAAATTNTPSADSLSRRVRSISASNQVMDTSPGSRNKLTPTRSLSKPASRKTSEVNSRSLISSRRSSTTQPTSAMPRSKSRPTLQNTKTGRKLSRVKTENCSPSRNVTRKYSEETRKLQPRTYMVTSESDSQMTSAKNKRKLASSMSVSVTSSSKLLTNAPRISVSGRSRPPTLPERNPRVLQYILCCVKPPPPRRNDPAPRGVYRHDEEAYGADREQLRLVISEPATSSNTFLSLSEISEAQKKTGTN